MCAIHSQEAIKLLFVRANSCAIEYGVTASVQDKRTSGHFDSLAAGTTHFDRIAWFGEFNGLGQFRTTAIAINVKSATLLSMNRWGHNHEHRHNKPSVSNASLHGSSPLRSRFGFLNLPS